MSGTPGNCRRYWAKGARQVEFRSPFDVQQKATLTGGFTGQPVRVAFSCPPGGACRFPYRIPAKYCGQAGTRTPGGLPRFRRTTDPIATKSG